MKASKNWLINKECLRFEANIKKFKKIKRKTTMITTKHNMQKYDSYNKKKLLCIYICVCVHTHTCVCWFSSNSLLVERKDERTKHWECRRKYLFSEENRANVGRLDNIPDSASRSFKLSTGSIYFFSFSYKGIKGECPKQERHFFFRAEAIRRDGGGGAANEEFERIKMLRRILKHQNTWLSCFLFCLDSAEHFFFFFWQNLESMPEFSELLKNTNIFFNKL